jgi:hypothetical protein
MDYKLYLKFYHRGEEFEVAAVVISADSKNKAIEDAIDEAYFHLSETNPDIDGEHLDCIEHRLLSDSHRDLEWFDYSHEVSDTVTIYD